ncbi:DedA family protein [Shimwellia pseudoproteus]|uniref:DedA family protein n=1 Tax=Shimwellia pseudoproteus TaxID=570012 RepID=UPI0018EAB7F2|nr:DedA family protein [Shimwellia pseudoproteus]MBJ3813470.1 DedA family protein [Shimwellia pseudoproteus]
METLFEQFISHSASWALFAIWLVAFTESLALVGLLMPGTLAMAGLGALIGSGQVSFYQSWLVAMTGCFLADWISLWLGWRFKRPLHRWRFLKKHKTMLDKTKLALHQHSMLTILAGRFIGPTRPLVPMVAGMLGLPVRKFIAPNILGCVLWPPIYFLPGILAGAAIDIPAALQSAAFKWQLLGLALLLWLAGWLCWRWWRSMPIGGGKTLKRLPRAWLNWLAPAVSAGALAGVVIMVQHPLMPVYLKILGKVLGIYTEV